MTFRLLQAFSISTKGGSVVMLAELSFGQTVAADALSALFTAVLVGFAATLVVGIFQRRSEKRRRDAEKREGDQLRREAEKREDQLQREATPTARLHDEQLQFRESEHQTRAALRETYAQFLIAQRRSREASLTLAKSGSAPGNEYMDEKQ